jgi:uncharacterized damage-inducible protein DinB
MKEYLNQLAAYNLWANQQLAKAILALPEEKQQAEIPSSFTNIYKTLLHMWDAESIWWQRMKFEEKLIIPSVVFSGSIQELITQQMKQSMIFEEWISNASEMALSHVFAYQNSKKEQFKHPVYQVLIHVFNHGTYHRGQLVNMLRQLGVEKIPQTDFIVWCRR